MEQQQQNPLPVAGYQHVFTYKPYKVAPDDKRSLTILNLKSEYSQMNPSVRDQAKRDAAVLLVPELQNRVHSLVEDGMVVCVVPSSKTHPAISPYQQWFSTVLFENQAEKTHDGKRFVNGTTWLKRSKVVPSSHSGDRNPNKQLDSIALGDGNSIVGKHVLLLDDIVTSGNTFQGVATKLVQLGAAQVTCLALAKTV